MLGEVTMSWRTKLLTAAIGLGVALSIGLSAAPAQARFFVGYGFGYPGFYRPYYRPYPVFYRPYIPPPIYVEPRPAYYVPPPPPPPVVYPYRHRRSVVRHYRRATAHRSCNCNCCPATPASTAPASTTSPAK
jgi:hypothetical protein